MSELKEALEKAREYRNQQKAGAATGAETKESKLEQAAGAMQEWRDIVSQRIEEAMRDGQFDNLRNKGKALKLERNPYVPEDMEMAYHILENNDLPPGWITERTAVLKQIDQLRARLKAAISSWGEREPKNLEGWRAEIKALNKRIETVNLQQPFAHLEIFKLRLEDEMARTGNHKEATNE